MISIFLVSSAPVNGKDKAAYITYEDVGGAYSELLTETVFHNQRFKEIHKFLPQLIYDI